MGLVAAADWGCLLQLVPEGLLQLVPDVGLGCMMGLVAAAELDAGCNCCLLLL